MVDFSALTSFSDLFGTGSTDGQFSVLQAINGGSIVTPVLTDLSGIDCHGVGFSGMAERWQAEVKGQLEKVGAALDELRELLTEEWEEGDVAAARKSYQRAAYNYGRLCTPMLLSSSTRP